MLSVIVATSFHSHSFVYDVIYRFCGDNVVRWTPPVKWMIWTLTLLQHLTRPAEGQPNSRSSLQDTGKVQMLGNDVGGYSTVQQETLFNSYNPYDGPNDNPELELPLTAGEYIYVYGDMDDDGFYEGNFRVSTI